MAVKSSPPFRVIVVVFAASVTVGFYRIADASPSPLPHARMMTRNENPDADAGRRAKRSLEDVVAEKNRLVEEKSRQVILEDLQGASLQEATRLLSNTETQESQASVPHDRQKYEPSGLNPNIEVVIEFLHERRNSSGLLEVAVGKDSVTGAGSPSSKVGSRNRDVDDDDVEEEDDDSDLWVKVDIGQHVGARNLETDANRHYSPWTKWSPCSVTCGEGFQFRQRTCGPDCTETAKRECRKKPCSDVPDDPAVLKSSETWSSLNGDNLTPLLLSLQQVMADFQGWDNPSNVDTSQGNACERWLKCPADDALRELTGVDELPDCPCTYSGELSSAAPGPFQWKDVSWQDGKLDIYNSGAVKCIRSVPALSSSVGRRKWTGLSIQNCCYDSSNFLLTRGSGAGTPHYVSSDVSPSLHRFVDILPWLACKGDFTRFHARRKPNNGNNCPKNPDDATYGKQVQAATTF